MTETIIYGTPYGNGQIYQPNFHNRYCAVLTGSTQNVGDGGNSPSVDWTVSTGAGGDFGRFHDDTLTGGIWFREEGYYVVILSLTFAWGTPPTTGTVEAVLTNSVAFSTVGRILVPVINEYEFATQMTAGGWFAADSYAYLEFGNYTDETVDCYSHAFVHRVG